MRLIDADVLKEWVENWFTLNRNYHPYSKNNNIPITELYDILERIPTMPSAQQEIIRCENCKHWHEDVANFISSIPRGGCKLVRGLTNGDFFCAFGERKEINSR